jgi:hypothetical protein
VRRLSLAGWTPLPGPRSTRRTRSIARINSDCGSCPSDLATQLMAPPAILLSSSTLSGSDFSQTTERQPSSRHSPRRLTLQTVMSQAL